MPKFFIDYVPEETAVILGEDALHIARSLRMKKGEPITLCDCLGMDYDCEIESVRDGSVSVRVLGCSKSVSEPSVCVTLYQALPKQDKFDLVVQKAVELGVTKIVPVLSSRCISRPDEKSLGKKLGRWQKIAVEAAKQSGRGILPTVEPLTPYAKAMDTAASTSLPLFFYEGGGERIIKLVDASAKKISVFIGPEGGFDFKEVELARERNAKIATLGPRILRTETAPVAALAAIMQATGNL